MLIKYAIAHNVGHKLLFVSCCHITVNEITEEIKMYISASMQALMPSLGTAQKNDVFGTTPVQHFVKDEVVFAPAQDPYAALLKAAERFQAGGKIFSEESKVQPDAVLNHA